MTTEPGARAVVVRAPLSGPIGPPAVTRARRAVQWLAGRTLDFWLYMLAGVVGAVGSVSEHRAIQESSASVRLGVAVVGFVGVAGVVWLLVNAIRLLAAVALLLLETLIRLLSPVGRPIGRAMRWGADWLAGVAVLSATVVVVVFVVGGVIGLLALGWRAF